MHGNTRGFEYIVILKEPIDKYDIVPDIMKDCRHTIQVCRIPYGNNKQSEIDSRVWGCGIEHALVIFSQDDTDDRMVETQYYKDRKDTWFDIYMRGVIKVSNEDLIDFILNNSEKTIIDKVLSHPLVRDNIKEYGIYDVVENY